MSAAKNIHWNHLQLRIPASWETIVKGPRHLIFEHDLSPLLEIRWQQSVHRSSQRHRESILKQFGQQYESRAVHACPALPDNIATQYDAAVLNRRQHSVESLLLVCRNCHTTILIGLHRKSFDWLINHTSLLDSIDCCRQDNRTERWQIQDFFFGVPSGFELDSCSFQFGISDLRFKHKHADLRICRLAPASQHLKQRQFKELFASFCSAPLESVQVVDARTLRYHSSANTIERMWRRIRRKRPFKQAGFSHFPGHDRILGFMVSANNLSTADWGAQLENGYGIIQETEAAGSDP